MRLAENVLRFWFGSPDITGEIKKRKVWFRSNSKFDNDIRKEFKKYHARATLGQLDHMKHSQKECLALIIILDQFSRNLYRDSAKAFETDTKAQELANYAIRKSYDKYINKFAQLFFYLPLEHSERLEDQIKSLNLISSLTEKQSSITAQSHYETILRFGRFPHRNRVLGRENTLEEEKYLKNPPNWARSNLKT